MLIKKATSKGGDCYACIADPNFKIYIPQYISRVEDQSHLKLYISISPIRVDTPVTTQVDDDNDDNDDNDESS